MILTLRIIAVTVGLCLIYAALFLYEDRQKNIQNKLEDWWIIIDDTGKKAISKHMAFIQAIASLTNSGFDRLFGKSLFSLQSVGVSACYAVASIQLFPLMRFFGETQITDESKNSLLSGAFLSLLIGTIPIFIKKPLGVKLWFLLFLYLAFDRFILPFVYMSRLASSFQIQDMVTLPYVIILSVGFGVLLFTIFVIVIRKIIKKIYLSKSSARIIIALLLTIMPVVTLYILLIAGFYSIGLLNPDVEIIKSGLFTNAKTTTTGILVIFLFCAIFINAVFLVPAIIFILLSITMFIHRVCWPFLGRSIYALQKLGIARRSKLFGSIGSMLIITALGGPTWIEKIIDLLSPS